MTLAIGFLLIVVGSFVLRRAVRKTTSFSSPAVVEVGVLLLSLSLSILLVILTSRIVNISDMFQSRSSYVAKGDIVSGSEVHKLEQRIIELERTVMVALTFCLVWCTLAAFKLIILGGGRRPGDQEMPDAPRAR